MTTVQKVEPVRVLIAHPNGPVLQINRPGSDDYLVRVMPDGTVDYGTDYEPDGAARIFWQALADTFPGMFAAPDYKDS